MLKYGSKLNAAEQPCTRCINEVEHPAETFLVLLYNSQDLVPGARDRCDTVKHVSGYKLAGGRRPCGNPNLGLKCLHTG